MIKRSFVVLSVLCSACALFAQTLNIRTGSTVWQFPAADAGEMEYADASRLTVMGKTFSLSEVDGMYVDRSSVTADAVAVTYNGTAAEVTVAGNIAKYLAVRVSGAHVAIVQDPAVATEIGYTLSGTSANGSFYLAGDYKLTLTLNALTLTCADSAAVNIRDGKRIALVLEGNSTLADGKNGTHNACLSIKGHPELTGSGTLTLTGNTRHALKCNEYMQLKKKFTGSIIVKNAVADGLHIGQYLEMNNGTITVEKSGDDCVQVEKTDDPTDELNGRAMLYGGTLNLTVTGAGSDTATVKGLKTDSLLVISDAIGYKTTVNITCTSSATAAKAISSGTDMIINGGTFNLTTAGGGKYDTNEKKTKASACLKADGVLTINGGTFTMKSTGSGGKGISGDSDVNITGGTLSITTTGSRYTYGSSSGGGGGRPPGGGSSSSKNNRSSAKGIKADGNVTVSGGTINVSATGGEGSEGIESKKVLTISGGTVESYTYDDALQATGNINISGGTVYARATGNDAIDSNASIFFSGGTTVAYANKSPEVPLDVDSPGYLEIKGGTVLAVGLSSNMTPYPKSSSTQPTIYYTGTVSLTNYVLMSGSTPVMAFKPEVYGGSSSGGWGGPGGGGSSSYMIMMSSPSLQKGSAYTLYSGATVSGDIWHGLYTSPSVTANGTSAGTVSSLSLPYSNTSK